MTPTALPSLKSSDFQEYPKAITAYMKVAGAQLQANFDEEKVRFTRVVGYLLLRLYDERSMLGNRPLERVVEEVMSIPQYGGAGGHDDIYKLGERYQNGLLRACASGYLCVFFITSVILQFGYRRNQTPHLPHTLQALLTVRLQRRLRR